MHPIEEREALTVRLRAGLIAQIKLHKSEGGSLNDLTVKALEREVRYRQGLATHHRIVARREKIRKKTGIPTDTTGLIRQLREGEGRDG